MNTIVNEGFFADAIVIVEGIGEVGVLWTLQEILDKNWIAKGISVIPASGKNNIDRAVIIFTGFKIPTYFIFDGDFEKNDNASKATNRRYLKLAGKQEEDYPETTVETNYAVFKNNIEDACKGALGETVFQHIVNEVALQLGIENKRVLKNIDSASEFVRKVYEKGYHISVLEQIVQSVMDMVN